MKFNEQVTIENYIIEFLSGVNPANNGRNEAVPRSYAGIDTRCFTFS